MIFSKIRSKTANEAFARLVFFFLFVAHFNWFKLKIVLSSLFSSQTRFVSIWNIQTIGIVSLTHMSIYELRTSHEIDLFSRNPMGIDVCSFRMNNGEKLQKLGSTIDRDDDETFLTPTATDDDQARIRRRAPTRHSIKSLSGRKVASKPTNNSEVKIFLISRVQIWFITHLNRKVKTWNYLFAYPFFI